MTDVTNLEVNTDSHQDLKNDKSTAAVSTDPVTASPDSRWWRVADFGVLSLWIAIASVTLAHHEKWVDEAQAWLMARDLDLKTIWFHELRYEGSPGLWHTLLWVAQHVFHAKYGALGIIGLAGATAGVALLIFKAPFPRYIRWPLAFTYFMIYQYAVIARPYTLLPLLAFASALLFKDLRHPERMTVLLVLLANLSLHGTILAGCLGLGYLVEAYQSRSQLDASLKKRYWICVGIMAVVFTFIAIILKPTPDVEVFVLKKELAQSPAEVQAKFPTPMQKALTVISGAFLDWPAPSVDFLLLAGLWCFTRRRALIYVLPLGVMIFLYAKVHGAPHHHGTIFVTAITALWIAWPEREEVRASRLPQRRALQGMIVLLLCVCALNIWDAEVAIRREYREPYSGAPDAANYLKSVGADRGPMFGFLMGITAIQAYFDHNVFANLPTAYYHHGTPFAGMNLDRKELRRVKPEYIVAYSQDPKSLLQKSIPLFTAEGYEIVHFSDGYYFYKRQVAERDVYFILRRVQPADSQGSLQAAPR